MVDSELYIGSLLQKMVDLKIITDKNQVDDFKDVFLQAATIDVNYKAGVDRIKKATTLNEIVGILKEHDLNEYRKNSEKYKKQYNDQISNFHKLLESVKESTEFIKDKVIDSK